MRFSRDEKWVLSIVILSLGIVTYFAVKNDSYHWIAITSLLGVLVVITLVIGNFRRLRARVDELGRDGQSVVALYSILNPGIPLPELGGYALSANKAAKLMELALDKKPKLIVELGSGVSTLVLAYCLKKNGAGRIVSYDHDENFARITRENVEKHNLSEYVEVIHAPIGEVEIGNNKVKWYQIDINKIDENIDFLFVDGPPRKTQEMARYPAMKFFDNKLESGAIVLLDDANRRDEIKIKELWIEESGGLIRDYGNFREEMFIARKK
ncbi:O-methyltransferase [Thiohalophilus sp.]|uniref:O-methyltransferase n=1 Tax=Thiohalophilus sp. TaxID=3028392 RepID=UPI003975A835